MDDISKDQAQQIGESIGIDFNTVDLDEFHQGMLVELEHGAHDSETNVTNNDLTMTAKIAWAHLKEIPDYYTRLKQMEAEAENK
jgi:hypothetical protein